MLESFPCFIATDKLAAAIEKAGLSGVAFESVEISVSDNVDASSFRLKLPHFVRLVPEGEAGVNDFGTSEGRLVVSERALKVLKTASLRRAEIEPFERPPG